MGRRRNKGYQSSSVWQHIGGSGYVDVWNGQREPSKTDLISAYEDVVFSCINLIGQNIACTGLNLYGKNTNALRGKTVTTKQLAVLKKSPVAALRLKGTNQVEAIEEHPLLDLLHEPNPFQNWFEFVQLLDAYLEVMGQSFVHIEPNGLGLPGRLTVLPSHLVTVVADTETGQVDHYDYLPSLSGRTHYKPEEIIHLKFPDLTNPYLDGFSPVRAIWERQLIGKKELAYLSNVYSNQARMDAVVAPEQPIGPREAERLSKELTQRYRGAGSGGIFVPGEKMNVYPLNWSPKDTSGLEVYKVIKIATANAFAVPMPLLEPGSNRAESEAAQYYLARYCLVPRLVRIAHALNKIAAMYDERLWFEFENPVPEDEQLALQQRSQRITELSQGVQNGAVLRDEYRIELGLPSAEWAQEPILPSNNVPLSVHEEQNTDIPDFEAEPVKPNTAEISQLVKDVVSGAIPRTTAIQIAVVSMGLTEETANKLFPATEATQSNAEGESPVEATQGATTPENAASSLLATVGGSQAIMDLQAAYYARTLPREAAIANAHIIFGLSEADAQALFPILAPDAPSNEQPAQPATEQANETEPPEDKAVDVLAEANELGEVVVPEAKASRNNLAKKWVRVLAKYFRIQRGQILQRLKAIDLSTIKTKAVLEPSDYKRESYEWKTKAGLEINVDLSQWIKPLAKELLPIAVQSAQEGQNATAQRLGIDVPKAVQPKLKESLQKSVLAFCKETNETTSLQLQDALAKLRDEVEAGTVQGDGRNEMRKRVQEVFDTAENDRAYRIAVTEQSRAISTAQKIVAEESGLVKGWRFVLSNDPCEICKSIAENNPEIALDGVFAKVSDHAVYGTIDRVPVHPHCQCSMQEILK